MNSIRSLKRNTNTISRMERENKNICENLKGKKVRYGYSKEGIIDCISIHNKTINISFLSNIGNVIDNLTVSFDDFIENGEILSQ